MDTKEKARRKVPAKKQLPTRSSNDVVYLPPKPFQRSRLIIRLATIAAVVIALIVGISIFFKVGTVVVQIGDEGIPVAKIEVSGNDKYSVWEIVEASGLEGGENLLTFSRAGTAGRIILTLPYIEEVRVGIRLPDTVVIEVTEVPVTYAVRDSSEVWWLLSSSGKVVEKAEGGAEERVTKLLGVRIQNAVVGNAAVAAPRSTSAGEDTPVVTSESQRLETALNICQYLEQNSILGKAASIDVSDMGNLQLWYGQQYQVKLGDDSQLAYKISYMKSAIAEMGSFQSGVLDVSFTDWPDKGFFEAFETPQQ